MSGRKTRNTPSQNAEQFTKALAESFSTRLEHLDKDVASNFAKFEAALNSVARKISAAPPPSAPTPVSEAKKVPSSSDTLNSLTSLETTDELKRKTPETSIVADFDPDQELFKSLLSPGKSRRLDLNDVVRRLSRPRGPFYQTFSESLSRSDSRYNWSRRSVRSNCSD